MKPLHIASLAAVALSAATGYYASRPAEPAGQHRLEKKTDEAGKTYWTCAMHPQVRQSHPGNCPICGMKLISKTDGGSHSASSGVVQIDPRMAQNLGVRTAEVRRGSFWQRVDATGSVVADERSLTAVEARSAGFIEALDVRAVGEPVQRGQRLARLRIPEVEATEAELALARKVGDAGLVSAAQSRLALLGGGSTLLAPSDGVITELNMRPGQQLSPGMALLKIANLSNVWVEVEVPEALAARVRSGMPAEVRVSAVPGRVWEAKVDYLYPQLATATRTLKLRLVLANPEGLLRPGQYAEVALFGGERAETLLIPSEAVIATGSRSVVIVQEADGRFKPAEVRIGDERNGESTVLAGLQAGEKVVVSGQFLIDSEASLQGVMARMLQGQQP